MAKIKTVKELMNLAGRKALVTGGAGHIGLVVGEALMELGTTVAVIDMETERCEGKVSMAFSCDLKDEAATRTTVQEAIVKMGGLDILIHCAAYVGTTKVLGWVVPFEEQTVAAWDRALCVNLTAAFVLVQEAKRALEKSGRGSVIFFSSTAGMVGPDNHLYEGTDMVSPAGYQASKGGLLQLTRYFATTLAPKIRVNAISPGGVWRNQPEVFHERYKSRTPLGRMATEEDLKGAVVYLASDLSQYVTGHNLAVDGGFTAW